MYLAGVAVLAVFALAQVPAVIYVARYCEEERGVVPVVHRLDDDESRESTPDASTVERDVEAIPAADAAAATRNRRCCPGCGADNHPEYDLCRGCARRLVPPGETGS